MLFQSVPLILKSPRISKCDGFPPDMSRENNNRPLNNKDVSPFYILVIYIFEEMMQMIS